MKNRKDSSTYSVNERALYGCDLSYGLSLITGRWKLQIIYLLANGALRFNEIRRSLALATEKMVADQLKALESDGLLARQIFPEVPVKVVYQLTEEARDLLPILDNLSLWAGGHRAVAETRGKADAD